MLLLSSTHLRHHDVTILSSLHRRYMTTSSATKEIQRHRIKLWEELKAERASSRLKSPLEIAAGSKNPPSKKAMKQFLVAEHLPSKRLIDLNAKELDEETTRAEDVRFATFEDPVGRQVFWHSSAHLLGYALEEVVGIERMHLRDGPPLKEVMRRQSASSSSAGDVATPGQGGFFYEFSIPADQDYSLTQEDVERMEKFINESLLTTRPPISFERLEFPSPESASEMFKHNPEKIKLISELVSSSKGVKLSAYRLGDFVDLCRGPHLPSAASIGFVKLLRSSGAGPRVYRVHGISFGDVKE